MEAKKWAYFIVIQSIVQYCSVLNMCCLSSHTETCFGSLDLLWKISLHYYTDIRVSSSVTGARTAGAADVLCTDERNG